MKRKLFLLLLVLTIFMMTGCSKIYINTQKSTETNVEIGSSDYLNRILNSIYSDKRFGLKSKMLSESMVNTTLDGEKYFYYIFSNNDIIRISETYDFVLYKDCKWYNLSYTMPTISEYESAYKYPIVPKSTWYFISYGVGEGKLFENEKEIVDESMFDNYKIDWIKEASTPEDFIKVRFFHYWYLKYTDERIKLGLSPVNYDYIKEIYSFNSITEYEQEIEDSFESFLYFAYYDNGKNFDLWLKNQIGKESYESSVNILSLPENSNSIKEYLSHIDVLNNLLYVNFENPSTLTSLLDSSIGIPDYTYSLDFNILSIYNNYNSNDNIVYARTIDATESNNETEANGDNLNSNEDSENDSNDDNLENAENIDNVESNGENIENNQNESNPTESIDIDQLPEG